MGEQLMAGPVAAGAQEFAAKLASFVKEGRLYGAAAGVIHGDELVWSAGSGFADAAAGRMASPSTLYRIASITKTFTGTAIMQLRDAGKLGLDDPAVKWIPELADSASPATIEAVTIRRLLSHESGLRSEPPGTDWMRQSPVYEGFVDQNLDRVTEIFTAVGPNRQTKYCNLGYQLLGEIVHRASGSPYPDYLAREILRPLGMSSTSFEPLDGALAGRAAVGYGARAFSDELDVAPLMSPIWAEGGLWSTVEDLARWLAFQLGAHAKPPAESRLLAAATLREMHTPRYLSDETWTSAFGISWYGERKDDAIWIQHSGGLHGFTSNVCFDPGQRVGAIALVNGSANPAELAMQLAGIARGLAKDAAPVIAPPVPTPEQFRPLLGVYAPADMTELIRLEWRDGKLMFLDPAEPSWRLELEPGGDADTFVAGPGFRQSGEPVRFSRRPDGKVASVALGGGTLLKLELSAS
jgi:CubicO group peptidase (beta-lactamase class C family)